MSDDPTSRGISLRVSEKELEVQQGQEIDRLQLEIMVKDADLEIVLNQLGSSQLELVVRDRQLADIYRELSNKDAYIEMLTKLMLKYHRAHLEEIRSRLDNRREGK